jgi:hypothetical protein
MAKEKLDVRLYAVRSNTQRFATLSWIEANKDRSIDMIGQIVPHEILADGASAEEIRLAKSQAMLYLRFVADKLELELSGAVKLPPFHVQPPHQHDLPKEPQAAEDDGCEEEAMYADDID